MRPITPISSVLKFSIDMDLVIRRNQFGSDEIRKKAMKQPAETQVKRGKNKEVDPLTGEVISIKKCSKNL